MATQANTDSLTQVLNREGWLAKAKDSIDHGSEAKAILFIDLDRFKFVNDSLGHKAGDLLLQMVAQLIEAEVDSPTDFVGRIGGDEFVVLLQKEQSVVNVEKIANRIIYSLSQPILLDTTEVEIGASIGISLLPTDSSDLAELLKYADLAMYRAKNSGRNQMVFFHQKMIKKIEYRRRIQTLLRKALREELLELNYLPVFDVQNNSITGAELHVSCSQIPELQSLDQEELFAIADESQVAISLSEWMLARGCEFLQRMQESELVVDIIVPIRPTHFHQNGFIEWLEVLLGQYEQSAENIVLQLNDSSLNAQRFPVEKQLYELQKLGVEVAVQNFGTGHLSPLKLHDWPIGQLNLSPTFTNEMTNKRSIASMAEALVQMGQMLNKKVVASGVTSFDQQEMLMTLNCYLMKGPLFSEPLSESNFERLCIHPMDQDGFFEELQKLDEY